jgi:hypothetical protein
MITFGFVLKSMLFGYFLAGWFGLMGELDKSVTERSGLLGNPTLPNKSLFVLVWFVRLFVLTYYIHMPNRGRGIVYGIVSPPIMWFGFSAIGALIMYPHLVIDNWILAIVASAAVFFLGATLLAPLVGMVCALIAYVIAQPILLFVPKRAPNDDDESSGGV